jgi:hypothetical protein
MKALLVPVSPESSTGALPSLGQQILAAIRRLVEDIRRDISPREPMHPVTLEALKAFPAQLEAHYAAIPAKFKHWKPVSWEGIPSEQLTAIEQVCHVRDVEIEGYQLRFQRALKEENPMLPSLDTDGLARDRQYYKQDAAKVLAEFRNARAKTIEMILVLSPQHLARKAEFEGYGQTTLEGLIHYLCSHDQQHLAGLQWLLGKIQMATA